MRSSINTDQGVCFFVVQRMMSDSCCYACCVVIVAYGVGATGRVPAPAIVEGAGYLHLQGFRCCTMTVNM